MNKLFLTSVFTLGIIASFVFFLVILAMLFLEMVDLPLAIGATIVINFVLWLIGPFITDLLNRWMYKVRFIPKESVQLEYPQVYSIISQVSNEYGFKFPKIGIIPDENPTAFTYGSARYNARIVLTDGIFTYLDDEEVKAVVAHELGHVVHRDFVIMMLASTFVQILYEVSAALRKSRSRKGNARTIGLIALVLYYIGLYLMLFLSRTREYLADRFASKYVHPQYLANALIKIAYGIVAAGDQDKSNRLLKSTRHLGILDVNNAKHMGAVSYVTNNQPELVSDVMVFDKVSPWAKVIELNSTHPLTGKRIDHLAKIAADQGAGFHYDVDGAIERMQINKGLLYSGFYVGILVYFAPILLGVVGLFFGLWLVPLGIGVGILIQMFYKFPQSEVVKTTILEEMRNPYASPIKGKSVQLDGQIIGRGVPGYVFGEDMMIQDSTGMTFLNYSSVFGFIGNLFFAVKKIKEVIGKPAVADGWFFRSISSQVVLKQVAVEGKTIRSHPMLWQMVQALGLIVLSLYLGVL